MIIKLFFFSYTTVCTRVNYVTHDSFHPHSHRFRCSSPAGNGADGRTGWWTRSGHSATLGGGMGSLER